MRDPALVARSVDNMDSSDTVLKIKIHAIDSTIDDILLSKERMSRAAGLRSIRGQRKFL